MKAPDGKDVAESGVSPTTDLGPRLFAWEVPSFAARAEAMAAGGGFVCLAGLGVLLGAELVPLGIGLMITGSLIHLAAKAATDRGGDSFVIHERGVTDAGRTLTWDKVARFEHVALLEETRVGGAVVEGKTFYRALLVGEDGEAFHFEGVGEDAAEIYQRLLSEVVPRLPAAALPDAAPPDDPAS